jgi:hypothetical protein
MVADKWLSNADFRQTIYFRSRVLIDGGARTAWKAQMIDHGLMFQGRRWTFCDSPAQGVYGNPIAQGGQPTRACFDPWINRLKGLRSEMFDEIKEEVPHEWLEAGEETVLQQLMYQIDNRRGKVARLVDESISYVRAKSRLVDCRLAIPEVIRTRRAYSITA